jgi:hypothetical protein
MLTRRTLVTAGLYPPDYVIALVAAAARRDHDDIDRITDALHRLGLARRRDDASQFEPVSRFVDDTRVVDMAEDEGRVAA